MRTFGIHNNVLCVLILWGVAVACQSNTQPSAANVGGVYRISSTWSTASCSPEQLPAPALNDSTQYVPLVLTAGSPSSLFEVAGSDDSVSLTHLDAGKQPVLTAALSGVNSGSTDILGGVTSPRTEGPREGGYTFYVWERIIDTVSFVGLVGTPVASGQRATIIGMNAQIRESDTVVFREGSPDAAIFTTCVVSGLATASRT